ncbi:hypothetical protein M378DRAFT_16659 [Amanita muscaria Koide BX008]|uniref:Uncharacterized protein n=1 Tax=Amanita muscaria (strain Koide BX008) TaxID=946122 RepID=A0A0C2SSC4_AMAMK|nr:hypothetical protein M378DRAFT_16659 [Amanita muscaria Koide BX008]
MSSDSPVTALASSLSLSGSSHLHDVARTVADYFSFMVNIRAWAETEVPAAPTAEERQALKKVADLVAAENRRIDLAIQALTTIKVYNEEFIKTHDSSHTSLSEFWNQFYSIGWKATLLTAWYSSFLILSYFIGREIALEQSRPSTA